MRIKIELADNGIIMRNPFCADDITVVEHNGRDRSNEYRAIGENVYDWLTNVVMAEQPFGFIVEGFDIDINVRCFGR